MYLLHFKLQPKSVGVNFHPESSWTFGYMPLLPRINKTWHQLQHAEGPAQPPKKRQHIAYLWSLSASICARLLGILSHLKEEKLKGHNHRCNYSTKIVFTFRWFDAETSASSNFSSSFGHKYGSISLLNTQKYPYKPGSYEMPQRPNQKQWGIKRVELGTLFRFYTA